MIFFLLPILKYAGIGLMAIAALVILVIAGFLIVGSMLDSDEAIR